MSDTNSEINIQNNNSELDGTKEIEPLSNPESIGQSSSFNSSPKWINNRGEEIEQVFGFNENAELVNARVAMIGFLLLLLTELAFAGEPATQKIFGLN